MKLNVIKQRNLWWTISALFILAGLVAMAISYSTLKTPLLPSLDFVGGTRIQLELSCVQEKNCKEPLDTAKVQEILTEQGLTNSSIQVVDNYTLSLRTQALNVEQRTSLQKALNDKIGKFDPETIQIDTVGPAIGKELFEAGFKALILSFFGYRRVFWLYCYTYRYHLTNFISGHRLGSYKIKKISKTPQELADLIPTDLSCLSRHHANRVLAIKILE